MAQKSAPESPRLQLRWEKGVAGPNSFMAGQSAWFCHYELVLPLAEHDIRREIWKDGEIVGQQEELVIPIKGHTTRGDNGNVPCVDRINGDLYFDAPFRDGVHSKWDAAILGGLPIYCVAPDGRFVKKPDEPALEDA